MNLDLYKNKIHTYSKKCYSIKNKLLSNHNIIFEEIINAFKYINMPFLLEKKNSILEKFIFDVVIHHLKDYGMSELSESVFIEFEFKHKNENLKFDINCDKYDRIVNNSKKHIPIFTTIIYLNNNDNPTIITDMNTEQYKYKEISNLCVCIPKKMNNIVFNGGS